MPPHVCIEPFNSEDLDAIVQIENRSFAYPWPRSAFLEELKSSYAWDPVVRCNDGGHVIAYACFRLYPEELHLLRLAVAPEWRHHGIATRLMEAGFYHAASRGALQAFLEVRPSNRPAKELYERLGFHLIGRRVRYYSDTGEDALVMMKNLEETT